MAEFARDEVESAFRNYFLTGPVGEDWAAWSRLFTEDATYNDHFWGTFHGREEIRKFLEGTMSFAAHVYSPLVWYKIDGSHIVYKVVNRADNPEPGGEPIEFPSLQVIQYAGGGKFSSEDDWWTVAEMKLFNQRYTAARERAGEFATRVRKGLDGYAEAGVTWLTVEPASRSLADFRRDVGQIGDLLLSPAR